MTTHDRDKILSAAKEAGFYVDDENESIWDNNDVIEQDGCGMEDISKHVERLYAIAHEAGRVAGFAASIEACQTAGPQEYPNKLITDGYVEAIRARSTKKQGLDDSISNLKPEDDCGIRYVE